MQIDHPKHLNQLLSYIHKLVLVEHLVPTLIPSSGNKIGFDESLKTMYETGKDLSSGYRETGKKGLGEIFK